MDQDLVNYYRDRAQEYEKVYHKPERQADLKKLISVLQSLFFHKEVLEIACGTGYWTERIAQTANSILATDINKTVIDIAKNKRYKSCVTFEVSDIYDLNPIRKHESLFGGFIWSHILLQELDHFITKVSGLVKPGGTLVFIDNNYIEGSSHMITKSDDRGNTYQTRTLETGASHLVLKNFPTREFVIRQLSGIAAETAYINLRYYWIVRVRLLQ
ncbi:class I SAM-dependent methyltransferase [Arachidicoccus terrestris]|uniref:class I SAM-dependent methyltransferase n=1 Tax=Arachidicoccus terrestris TaxID=2875539 RepID=UPI001CC3C83C|nr:class I SAM-dependent methyltransferase [Arachidicoccus terrestris]UAY54436.1 class I SAM-dependent methyltransferase [Arachidicoccus terrestris]